MRHKLDRDYYTFRRPVYQLYPMINHLRLFGPEYAKPLAAVGDVFDMDMDRTPLNDIPGLVKQLKAKLPNPER